ncbi:stage II sporulation protein P [Ruminococcus albus]|uniref:Stage II sporulation protein P n=1 Tax=Ruminococcus albus 8 TaxID=246199 RepID=E9SFX0_RUMAL|nr:stage II sporulation protein P [Ruminococcus albus]EGC01745.1 stage II sporulation protein P [Ruminococcus albus 8]MCC3352612.1 stage II sporulation protein P [Ruminococcus albus 8]
MELKNICLRALAVICAVFVLPMGIFAFAENSDKLFVIARGSSKLVMLDRAGDKQHRGSSLPVGAEINESNYWDIATAPTETEPEPTSAEVPSPLPAEDVNDLIPYPTELTDHDGVIQKYTYGHYDDTSFFDLPGGGQVRNCTDYDSAELLELSKAGLPFDTVYNDGEPVILIYHTHATESFELTDREWYDKDFGGKTTERDKNIISVGDKICEQLDAAGIPYIHDTLVHDYPSYDDAYYSSRDAVQKILAEYPSIKVCLDIHRDGIEREDGTRISPVAEIDGREAAQIMLISCADDGSGDLPDFRENFRFASVLQSRLENEYPCLTRPILFDTRFYNQDLSTGSLLIEVGSHGNTLEQAQYSGELIGKTLAGLFL